MKYSFGFIVFGFLFGFANPSTAFVIDVRSCPSFTSQAGTVYEFDFDQSAFQPDVTVQVSQVIPTVIWFDLFAPISASQLR